MDEERWLKKRAENLELLKSHKRNLDRQYVFTYLNLSWIVIFGIFFLMDDGFIWGTWDPPGVMETIFMLFSWPAIAGAGFAVGHAIDAYNLDSTQDGDYPRISRWRFNLMLVSLVSYWLVVSWFPDFFFL